MEIGHTQFFKAKQEKYICNIIEHKSSLQIGLIYAECKVFVSELQMLYQEFAYIFLHYDIIPINIWSPLSQMTKHHFNFQPW